MISYRPEIDGLRAVAVVPVILFHAGFPLFAGGFVGVDVFFVISGYLITLIICREIDEGRFSILGFYARRARRILPALTLVTLLSVPIAWHLMLPSAFRDFAQSVAAVGVFASNILFWIESGYFDTAAELKPLLHTWSLAVEEQYYLFFPVLMIALWHLRRRAILVLCGLFLTSLLLSEILWRTAPDANFFLIPSRIWELMAGSLCAVWQVTRGRPTPRQGLSALGLALILVSVFLFDHETPFPSLYALVPVSGTALLILFAGQGTWSGGLLASRGPVAIGLISYSAYLWHQPLFAFARIYLGREPYVLVMLGLSALSLIMAYLSWRLVERPFRRGLTAGPRMVVLSACAVSVLTFGLGAVLAQSGLQRSAFIAGLDAGTRTTLRLIETVRDQRTMTQTNDLCRFAATEPDSETRARMASCAARFGPGVVVFGDSHSADLYDALAYASDAPFLVHFAQQECRPHIENSPCDTSRLFTFLETSDQMGHVGRAIYTQAGFWFFADANGEVRARNLFFTGDAGTASLYDDGISRNLDVLGALPDTLDLVWLGPRFDPHIQMERYLGFPCSEIARQDLILPEITDLYERLDVALSERAADRGIDYVSLQKLVDFDPAVDLMSCEALYLRDTDHWSEEGQARFGQRILSVLESTPDK